MTPKNSITRSTHIKKPMLIGAGLGLILISVFVFGAKTNPEWGPLWRIRPLIVVPAAGALGGAFYYWMNRQSSKGKINRTVAIILSLIVFMFAIWVGIILGLDGTLWD